MSSGLSVALPGFLRVCRPGAWNPLVRSSPRAGEASDGALSWQHRALLESYSGRGKIRFLQGLCVIPDKSVFHHTSWVAKL